MTPTLSEDQRQAIKEHGGSPVYLVDAITNTSYVLLRAEQFEKMKAIIAGDDAEALYPLLADTNPEDWEDIRNYDQRS